MRLPKTVRINNRPWDVVRTNKVSTANFNYRKMKINIGTASNSSREILAGFLHEVAGISAIERGIRSTKDMIQHEANDHIFTSSHAQFSNMMCDVSAVVGDMMKMK